MDRFTRHQPPENLRFRFDGLRVRLYGDLGTANGPVVTSDEHGRDFERPVFTDVFVYRSGHWQAINAQETLVRQPPSH